MQYWIHPVSPQMFLFHCSSWDPLSKSHISAASRFLGTIKFGSDFQKLLASPLTKRLKLEQSSWQAFTCKTKIRTGILEGNKMDLTASILSPKGHEVE
jgi:hypothetical protein